MKRSLVLAAFVALTGCAQSGPPEVAVCDGKHLRPANLYGSVLPEAALEQPKTAPVTDPAVVSPSNPTKSPTISQIDPHSFDLCGRPA